MSNEVFKIPRASDRLSLDVLRELGKQFGSGRAHVAAVTGVTASFDSGADDPMPMEIDLIRAQDSNLIESFSWSIGSLNVNFYRGGNAVLKSPILDEIHINFQDGQHNPSVQVRLQIVKHLADRFGRVLIGAESGGPAGDVIAQVVASHQSNLSRLEKLNEDLIKNSDEFRRSLEHRTDGKIAIAEEMLSAKEAQLQTEFQDKERLLAEREKDIADRIAKIDASDNTTARRKIRDRMLEDVKSRINDFGLSQATSTKRKPVISGMYLLGLVGVVLVSVASGELTWGYVYPAKIDPNSWMGASVRLAIGSLSLVGTLIYYIKYQMKWAEQHANSEFQLQQFYIDVNRANWVIESCLEWRRDKGAEIPPELLTAMTSGLFSGPQPQSEKVLHPADELASALLGSASKLKLKMGNGEMEFDKPGKIPN